MGMFDSLYIECPNCKKQLEFQSKSGACALFCHSKDDLTIDVAIGMNGDIIKCEFCNKNFQLVCDIPLEVEVALVETKDKEDYFGNYNPELLKNKEKLKKLKKDLEENEK